MIVLSDSIYGGMGWLIRWRAKLAHQEGFYCHASVLYSPRNVASQGWTFRREPIASYFGGNRLKFWTSAAWTAERRQVARQYITAELRRPLYFRVYDWLGVIGHAIGFRWLQIPWRAYCSERAADVLAILDPAFDLRHPTPAEINTWCKVQPHLEVYGRYDPELCSA